MLFAIAFLMALALLWGVAELAASGAYFGAVIMFAGCLSIVLVMANAASHDMAISVVMP